MSAPEAFALNGALPRGPLVIEASAGTGKTFTIAGLIVRFVAETDLPIDRLLVVTFTRAAARELRARVRRRLEETLAALAGGPVPGADELLVALCSVDRELRRDRLAAALAQFESATIATIHSFAQQALVGLGAQVPTAFDPESSAEGRAVLREAVVDALASVALGPDAPAGLPKVDVLVGLVGRALNSPDIVTLTSAGGEPSSEDRIRRLVFDRALDNVRRRRAHTGRISYGDQLVLLRGLVADDPAMCEALSSRFDLVLIDEFQDTDGLQWEILSRLYARDVDRACVLVGDPKQAIYSFRGANVHAYLRAAHSDGTRLATLGTNWRSDGALVDACNRLFAGVTFGHPDIPYREVAASEEHRARRLGRAGGGRVPALGLRILDAPEGRAPVGADQAGQAIADDLAAYASRLLDGTELPDGAGSTRPLLPSDIAVLVGTGSQIEPIERALAGQRIPAVRLKADSVWTSEAKDHWRALLEGLCRAHDPRRVRAAGLTWFFERDVAALATGDERYLRTVEERLRTWSEELAAHGVGAFWWRVLAESGLAARLLGAFGGERHLTDAGHIASLLAAEAGAGRPTPAALLLAFDRLDAGAGVESDPGATARRIASEDAAVQILTVHGAKGLEFPVVLVPTMWRAGNQLRSIEHVFEDPVRGRTLDLARTDATLGPALEEAVGENLRLLYVACTRARHHLALWFASGRETDRLGLARVLFARDAEASVDPEHFARRAVEVPAGGDRVAAVARIFGPLARGEDPTVEVAPVGGAPAGGRPPVRARPAPAPLGVARLVRVPGGAVGRWSFTAITRHAAEAPGGRRDPDDDSLGDTGAGDEPEPDPGDVPDGETDLPLGAVPGGVAFGTLVHRVLESTDFAAADLDAELDAAIARHGGPAGPGVDAGLLRTGLRAVLETPLGGPFGDLPLRGVHRSDRLDEVHFELHLGSVRRVPTIAAIGALVSANLTGGDPLASWAHDLAERGDPSRLAGHLTGSIDLVVRRPGAGGAPDRYFLFDYKTNLPPGATGRLPRAADYHPDALPGAMAAHDYPLQALLYAVALHRYLRWRLPGYDPGVHLGGVAYLFLRAMSGPATPVDRGRRYGVFTWELPAALVEALSGVLAGGRVP